MRKTRRISQIIICALLLFALLSREGSHTALTEPQANTVIQCGCEHETKPDHIQIAYSPAPYKFVWFSDVDKREDSYCYFRALKNLRDDAPVRINLSLRPGELEAELVEKGELWHQMQFYSLPPTQQNIDLELGYTKSPKVRVPIYSPDEKMLSAKSTFKQVPGVGGVGAPVAIRGGVDTRGPIQSEFYANLVGANSRTKETVHIVLMSFVRKTDKFNYEYLIQNRSQERLSVRWRTLADTQNRSFDEVSQRLKELTNDKPVEARITSDKPPGIGWGNVEIVRADRVIAKALAPAFVPSSK